MIDKLFVYGTLRSDVPESRSGLLGPDAELVGCARMAGRLLDLGPFPGFLPMDHGPSGNPESDQTPWVRGELYIPGNPAEILSRLDRYEGCGPADPEPHLFERVVGTAVRGSGRADVPPDDLEAGPKDERTGEGKTERTGRRDDGEEAWVYVYRGPTRGGIRIPSGDYAVHRGEGP